MRKTIAVVPGDGIGVEVTEAALDVLKAMFNAENMELQLETYLIGGASLDAFGEPIKDEVVEACKKADAVLLGAVGGPAWDNLPAEKRPEKALLRLRKELGLYNNLRPVKVYPSLTDASTLREEVVSGVDLLVVRELTGGLYFGLPKETKPHKETGGEQAVDSMVYHTFEIERIVRDAFEAARKRRRKLTSVDKANILVTSQLWRKTVERLAKEYPDVEVEHMLVDNCAMQLVRNPKQFDVIVTENMFGDILSDEAAMLTGSIGMLPSASLGTGTGMYEPVHGSAPDIAGKNIANPLATIASVAMMLRFSLDLPAMADTLETAIQEILSEGYRCADLTQGAAHIVGTREMAELIKERVLKKV
ncbi:MAG: 3-isopropylmalate dehydrogenase [Bacteroidetes bacterium]|nr:3-isopropylmalate dehydrogenase [Bacteroidota bacterium]MCH8523275.1 3-isopropylmalate dehydrogenase [Balneolales bacterium]